MPIVSQTNAAGEQVDHYVVPVVARTIDVTDALVDVVRDRRKDYARTVEQFHAMQKQFGKDKDFDAAREMKDLIKLFTQLEKASTLVVNWYTRDINLSTISWPRELATLLDGEFNAIDLAAY